ncbi:MAG: hypothetical protein KF868_07800 [Acidobacteria bacterium]|nr:hypothetical protein [Acidobacteriota bacterium]
MNGGRMDIKATTARIAGLAIILCLVIPTIGEAQRRRTPATRRPAPAPQPPPIDMAAEAAPVADQLKNLSQFIYVYGKIVNGIEFAEQQDKRGEATPEIATRNQKTREGIVANIQGLRAGIVKAGERLQAESRLQVQYLKLTSAADAVANAERLATAGRYDDAGKSLITAIERLTDTIISFR